MSDFQPGTTDPRSTFVGQPKNCNRCAHSQEVVQPGEVVRSKICTRFPPQSFPTPQGVITIFPFVHDKMWCGEFKEWEQ